MNEMSTFDILWVSFLLSVPSVILGLMSANPLIPTAQILWVTLIGIMVVNRGE